MVTNATGKDPAVIKLNSGNYLLLVLKSILPLFYSESLTNGLRSKNNLFKLSNILGKEIKPKRNTILFYIYDDGTVEKRIVIK